MLARLRADLLAAQVARDALQDALDTARTDAALAAQAHAVALSEVQQERDTLDAQRRGLQRRLDALTGPAVPPLTLAAGLRGRGLLGGTEVSGALAALDQRQLLPALLEQVVAADPDALRSFLGGAVSLLCEACAPGASKRVAVVRVPGARCEVCEGTDAGRAARRFLDGCLMLGITKALIVGGSPTSHTHLRAFFERESRVTVRLLPGDRRIAAPDAKDLLRSHGVVVIWGGTILDHAVSEPFLDAEAHGCRRVMVAVRGAGRMLDEAAEALGRSPA